MGVPWHKKEEKPKKEWVIYAAAGVVLLIVAGAVTLGVVLGGKASDNGQQQQAATQGSISIDAPAPAAAAPMLPQTATPASSPPQAAPTPAPAPIPAPVAVVMPPTLAPVPAPVTAAPPLPLAGSPPPPTAVLVASPPPPPVATPAPTAAPTMPAPTAAPTTAITSTYNPAVIAPGTLTGPPNGRTSESYPPPEIRAGREGTCELQNTRQFKCNDDMDYGSTNTVPIENLQLMHDAQQMEPCGFADMTQIVNGLVKWAYREKCGIEAFTVSRACIGKAGIADGFWRSRVMLWPLPGGDPTVCIPLCIKMRGMQNTVTDYGRTAGC